MNLKFLRTPILAEHLWLYVIINVYYVFIILIINVVWYYSLNCVSICSSIDSFIILSALRVDVVTTDSQPIYENTINNTPCKFPVLCEVISHLN